MPAASALRPVRSFVVGLLGMAAVGLSSLLAQDDVYDGRSTEDTVRLVVGGLVGIAVAVALLTVLYLWHTSPGRRLRIAEARAGSDD